MRDALPGRTRTLCKFEMDEEIVTMFRPTGLEELRLVRESGFKKWPARLQGQPLFVKIAA